MLLETFGKNLHKYRIHYGFRYDSNTILKATTEYIVIVMTSHEMHFFNYQIF